MMRTTGALDSIKKYNYIGRRFNQLHKKLNLAEPIVLISEDENIAAYLAEGRLGDLIDRVLYAHSSIVTRYYDLSIMCTQLLARLDQNFVKEEVIESIGLTYLSASRRRPLHENAHGLFVAPFLDMSNDNDERSFQKLWDNEANTMTNYIEKLEIKYKELLQDLSIKAYEQLPLLLELYFKYKSDYKKEKINDEFIQCAVLFLEKNAVLSVQKRAYDDITSAAAYAAYIKNELVKVFQEELNSFVKIYNNVLFPLFIKLKKDSESLTGNSKKLFNDLESYFTHIAKMPYFGGVVLNKQNLKQSLTFNDHELFNLTLTLEKANSTDYRNLFADLKQLSHFPDTIKRGIKEIELNTAHNEQDLLNDKILLINEFMKNLSKMVVIDEDVILVKKLESLIVNSGLLVSQTFNSHQFKESKYLKIHIQNGNYCLDKLDDLYKTLQKEVNRVNEANIKSQREKLIVTVEKINTEGFEVNLANKSRLETIIADSAPAIAPSEPVQFESARALSMLKNGLEIAERTLKTAPKKTVSENAVTLKINIVTEQQKEMPQAQTKTQNDTPIIPKVTTSLSTESAGYVSAHIPTTSPKPPQPQRTEAIFEDEEVIVPALTPYLKQEISQPTQTVRNDDASKPTESVAAPVIPVVPIIEPIDTDISRPNTISPEMRHRKVAAIDNAKAPANNPRKAFGLELSIEQYKKTLQELSETLHHHSILYVSTGILAQENEVNNYINLIAEGLDLTIASLNPHDYRHSYLARDFDSPLQKIKQVHLDRKEDNKVITDTKKSVFSIFDYISSFLGIRSLTANIRSWYYLRNTGKKLQFVNPLYLINDIQARLQSAEENLSSAISLLEKQPSGNKRLIIEGTNRVVHKELKCKPPIVTTTTTAKQRKLPAVPAYTDYVPLINPARIRHVAAAKGYKGPKQCMPCDTSSSLLNPSRP